MQYMVRGCSRGDVINVPLPDGGFGGQDIATGGHRTPHETETQGRCIGELGLVPMKPRLTYFI